MKFDSYSNESLTDRRTIFAKDHLKTVITFKVPVYSRNTYYNKTNVNKEHLTTFSNSKKDSLREFYTDYPSPKNHRIVSNSLKIKKNYSSYVRNLYKTSKKKDKNFKQTIFFK